MSEEYRDQIYSSLNLKSTEVLLDIWQKNERFNWSDTAFEVVQEILEKRLEELPPQNEAVHEKRKEKKEKQGLSSWYSQADNNGCLYDPQKILKLCKWLDRMVIIYFIIILLSFSHDLIFFFPLIDIQSISDFWESSIPFWLNIYNVFVYSVPYMFLFKVMSYLIKTLLEMELNSREIQEEG